jgi:hypothetical protein
MVWTFFNLKAGEKFVNFVSKINKEGHQAEGYFQCFKLPGVQLGVGNEYHPAAKFQFMTVSIGSTEQYVNLHKLYDTRAVMNAGRTTQTKHQVGIKSVVGTLYCMKDVAPIKTIFADWNTAEECNMQFIKVPGLSVAGGWSTVARFVRDTAAKEVLMSYTVRKSADVSKQAAIIQRSKDLAANYAKSAPQLSDLVVFKGVASPIDFAVVVGDEVHSFGIHCAGHFLKTTAAVAGDFPVGVTSTELYFGAGVHAKDLKAMIITATASEGRVVLALSDLVR